MKIRKQSLTLVGTAALVAALVAGCQTTDPYTGQTYQVPRFSVTTTLSPEQQAIKTQQDGASLNLATLGNDLSGTLGDHLRGNFTIGNESTEARLFDLGRVGR